MPEYLSPGVYVEELSGPKPIEGVGTSNGAFVGIAERGPVNSPQLITNMTQFFDTFGGFLPQAHLAYGVQHFFTEGGTRCYVVRVYKPADANDPQSGVAKADLMSADSPPAPALRVKAVNPGAWGNRISVRVTAPSFDPADKNNTQRRFRLEVFYKGGDAPVEAFDRLSMAELDSVTGLPNPDHVETRINGSSNYIRVADLATTGPGSPPTQTNAPPAVTTLPVTSPPTLVVPPVPLGGGSDGLPPGSSQTNNLMVADLIGGASTATDPASGLHAFDTVDDINIVAIPDIVNPAFAASDMQTATNDGFTYCSNRKDCFFVADSPQGLSPQGVLAYKQGTTPAGNPFNSKYGALYYPWIYATDPLTGKRRLLPPSGAVAGSYSASDVRVGVHKAPAGVEDGFLNSAADIERIITKGEHDVLNPEGINVIRKFPDAGIVIWGARTVSADPEWKYLNVRRLFIFLEESILKGTQSVVFEPNDRALWKRITRDVSAFLRVQWREGKLVGDKPEKAFFVKCDEETNPPESVDLGRVITLIGVAPSKPAEFVIFRIRQTKSGGGVEE